MRFTYKAINKAGETLEGSAEANDKFELARMLKAEGKMIVEAESEEEGGGKSSILERIENMLSTVGLREKIVFMRNLAAMIEAGLPLTRALAVLQRQSSNNKFKSIISSINESVNKGSSFSDACSKFPKIFPQIAVSMIRAGEESGKLPESLTIIGEQFQKSYLLRKRIRGALMYPSIIMTAMVAIGILMFIYVVPTLTGVFEELNVELPTSTKIIIATSDFLRDNTVIALILLVVIVILLVLIYKSDRGKRMFEFIFLHIPVIGVLVKQVNAALTSRTLSSLLSSGVKMVDGISITMDVIQNLHFKDVLKDAGERVQKGTQLSKVFSENEDLYPILMGEMVAVGEETGKLSEMLMRIATFYEGEIEQKTKDMSTIIEPILMVVVGIGVGFFAVSMLTPLYSVLQGI
jgi:type IV pilus assembly protein PilC